MNESQLLRSALSAERVVFDFLRQKKGSAEEAEEIMFYRLSASVADAAAEGIPIELLYDMLVPVSHRSRTTRPCARCALKN